jgi:hypothetical protein
LGTFPEEEPADPENEEHDDCDDGVFHIRVYYHELRSSKNSSVEPFFTDFS